MVHTVTLGDRLLIGEAVEDLQRFLFLKAILAVTIRDYGQESSVDRAMIARVLREQVDSVLSRAENATLRTSSYFTRSPGEMSDRISAFYQRDELPQEAREAFDQWQRRYPDFAQYLADLPKEVGATLSRNREILTEALDDFVFGRTPEPIPLTCEGSAGECAVLGFLTGFAAAVGAVPAAAAGVAGIGWCCT